MVSSLYLASAVAQPTAGKLAEVLGARRIFLSGIVLVLVGGVVGGLGQSLAMLTVARVLVGIGTSAAFPCAMVLIRRRATEAGLDAPPGGVLGGIAIAGMATAAIGPPIGGLLVAAGWRWAFLINIPVTAVALAMTVRWLPRIRRATTRARSPSGRRPDRPARHRRIRRIDERAGHLPDETSAGRVDPSPAFVLVAAPTVVWELRQARAVLRLPQPRRQRPPHPHLSAPGTHPVGVYSVMYGMTQWMEAAHGMSTVTAGLLLLPMEPSRHCSLGRSPAAIWCAGR